MSPKLGEGISGAVFSEDRRYRYQLWRIWDREKPALIFIGLNPSTAGGIHDDPTIMKLAAAAKRLGYGGLYAGNLFAVVSPNPEELRYGDAVGDNDRYLEELKHVAGVIVAGWGNLAISHETRVRKVLMMLGPPVYCFAITKRGQPAHPLYLNITELKEFFSPMPVKT